MSLKDMQENQPVTDMVRQILELSNGALIRAMANKILGENETSEIHNEIVDLSIAKITEDIDSITEGERFALGIMGQPCVRDRTNTTIAALKGIRM